MTDNTVAKRKKFVYICIYTNGQKKELHTLCKSIWILYYIYIYEICEKAKYVEEGVSLKYHKER
jgi:hypothetical protein